MIDPFYEKLYRGLWEDLDETQEPPLLAHYTSIEALENIIKSGELWLSNPLFMNDWEELKFGLDTAAQELRSSEDLRQACKSAEAHGELMYWFDHFHTDYHDNHKIDTYVACFTEHEEGNSDGILSMWRGYGSKGNGAAIILNLNSPNLSEGPLILGKVHYGTREQRKNWIKGKITSLAHILKDETLGKNAIRNAAYEFFSRIQLFTLFSKHNGFKEENEWRLVYLSQPDGDYQLADMMDYSITRKGIEPKLKLKIASILQGSFELHHLVEGILLGPSVSSDLTLKVTKKMLAILNHPEMEDLVTSSSIPYREI